MRGELLMIDFLRTNPFVKWALLLIRVYLGWKWLSAGIKKYQSGSFDSSGLLKGAIANANSERPTIPDWWGGFLESFALPNVDLFNFIVPLGEVLVGLGLIVGLFTRTAIFFGLFMNFAFVLSGAVSANPVMIILSLFVLVSLHESGKVGVDGILRKKQFTLFKRGQTSAV
ncbi:DoxX family membrane protein [Paenibacillus agilis]|uniref:DoxX family protein n=1 Tax=Paenibacillus agilis TaxID=3020863 RepID=A0A559IHY1_9BACL|nr:DoxX family protein [Paenibacillus agilis]TVX87285.1 DoxX family protein [Paenibacillus agilis]